MLHLRAAQIEHAMRQARGLGEIVIVELERWRNRCIEYVEFMTQHFDLA